MSAIFEELDFCQTRFGGLSLRRRKYLSLGVDVIEVKLGDEFLMSSLFTAGEIALATLALGELDTDNLDVVVGGLGLGYTAHAVLENPGVRSLFVIEAIHEGIAWHRRGLLPLGSELVSDKRCQLIEGDFFAMVAAASGSLASGDADRRFHAISCRYRSFAACDPRCQPLPVLYSNRS